MATHAHEMCWEARKVKFLASYVDMHAAHTW
jgi:hypothetical protein